MKARKVGKLTTTREIYWNDVDVLSLYKKKVIRFAKQKEIQYESDKDLLHRIIEYWVKNHPNPPNAIPVSTYPLIEQMLKTS